MEGLFSLLLFAVFFYLMMRFGCGSHRIHGHADQRSHGDKHVAKHVDPVCGRPLETNQGYGIMHAGRLYRFCSRMRLDKFEATPERFLNAVKQQGGGSP